MQRPCADDCSTCNPNEQVSFDQFLDYVRPYCTECPEELMVQYVRAAAVEFARRTLTLQRDIYVDVQAGVQDYIIDPVDSYSIHMLRQVSFRGRDLKPMQRPPTSYMPCDAYYFERPCKIMLGPVPECDEREALLIRATVIPSQKSCEVDAHVLDYYAEDIATGALSRLMLMPETKWYSTQQGGIMLKRWRNFLNLAKVERAKNDTAGPVYMREQRFI